MLFLINEFSKIFEGFLRWRDLKKSKEIRESLPTALELKLFFFITQTITY